MAIRLAKAFGGSALSRKRLLSRQLGFLNAAKMRFRLDIEPYYLHNVVEIVLGELEYCILSSSARLGADAYGAAIRQDMHAMTGRQCSLGALYTTLERLERKGLIRTWMGEPSPERGGRAKKMVRITAKGVREAQVFYDTMIKVSVDTAWVTGGVHP